MDGEEILRIVDAIHRDKDIDKELLFQSIEDALATAARKRYDAGEELTVIVDRKSGEVTAYMGDEVADFVDLGRIGAQTAKQVMIQRIREAEQAVVMHQYNEKVGEIVNGVVHRIEGGNIIVNLGRGEGILPRSETVRSEHYAVGDRIKALITEVRKIGLRVRIILSRTSPDLVRCLFELEVPEIGDEIIDIKQVAREPGARTKIAVLSYDDRVDPIGACVGIRGTRIKAITEELNGEKVDIIPWSDDPLILLENALRPAEISRIEVDEETNAALVIVGDDQLSLAIGRRGQNVRLASKLTGWDVNLKSMSELHQEAAGSATIALEGEEGAEAATEAAPAPVEDGKPDVLDLASDDDAEATSAGSEPAPEAEAEDADADADAVADVDAVAAADADEGDQGEGAETAEGAVDAEAGAEAPTESGTDEAEDREDREKAGGDAAL